MFSTHSNAPCSASRRRDLRCNSATLIGFEPVHVERGAAVFRLDARRDKHANPLGTIHGGILCDIADGAMGMACASLLEPGESFITIEFRMTFLRPLLDAQLEACAPRVIKSGNSPSNTGSSTRLTKSSCEIDQHPFDPARRSG